MPFNKPFPQLSVMETGYIRTVTMAPPPHYYSKHDYKCYSRNNFRGRTGSHNRGCQWWMVTGTESFQLGEWQSTPPTLFWKRVTSAQWFQIWIVVTEQNLTPHVRADKIPSVFLCGLRHDQVRGASPLLHQLLWCTYLYCRGTRKVAEEKKVRTLFPFSFTP